MNLLYRYKAVAVTAAAFGAILFSSMPSFAGWELRVWTDGQTYLASYSNECSVGSNDCSAVTMCGNVIYISGASRVLNSYKRGNKVILIPEGGQFSNALCTAQQ